MSIKNIGRFLCEFPRRAVKLIILILGEPIHVVPLSALLAALRDTRVCRKKVKDRDVAILREVARVLLALAARINSKHIDRVW